MVKINGIKIKGITITWDINGALIQRPGNSPLTVYGLKGSRLYDRVLRADRDGDKAAAEKLILQAIIDQSAKIKGHGSPGKPRKAENQKSKKINFQLYDPEIQKIEMYRKAHKIGKSALVRKLINDNL